MIPWKKIIKKDVHSLNCRIDELTQENDVLRKENQQSHPEDAGMRSGQSAGQPDRIILQNMLWT